MNFTLKTLTLFFYTILMFTFFEMTVLSKSEWTFGTMKDLTEWTENAIMLQYEIKNGKCEFVPTSNTPSLSVLSDTIENIDLAKYRFIALRMNSESKSGKSSFVFYINDTTPQTVEFDIIPDGKWHEYLIDLDAEGLCKKITFNLIKSDTYNSNERILVDRIGFFEDKVKANDFLKKNIISLKEPDKLFTPTGKDAPSWIFSNTGDISDWKITGEPHNETGLLKIVSGKESIVLKHDFSSSKAFLADEFHYFAFRYKTNSTFSGASLLFSNDILQPFSDGSQSFFTLKNDDEWHNLIIDMSKYAHRLWSGIVTQVTLNALITEKAEEEILIERLGFFSSYNDADLFLSKAVENTDYSLGTVFSGSMFKVIVPDGSLFKGYKQSDFTLYETGIADENKNPIILFTNAQGSQSAVPLSEISSRGFIRYVARFPGYYSVGSSHKDYTDIQGHWGEEYINYVSERTLFLGTSETEFSPEKTMTRGMFITVLGRMHGIDLSLYNGDSGYIDVDSSEYYSPYIQWAKEKNIFPPIDEFNFAPMQPITREVMAMVIFKYINSFGYDFGISNHTIQFEDLFLCTDEIRSAISSIQSLGIINGRSPDSFDPGGTSTRAEVAAVMTRLIKSILGIHYNTSYDSDYFEKEKIRIGAFCNFESESFNESLFAKYVDCGFNFIIASSDISMSSKRDDLLTLCDKSGLNLILSDQAYKDINSIIAQYFEHPSFYGTFISDEPGQNSIEKLSAIATEYTEKVNGKIPFINLLPLYASSDQLKYGAFSSPTKYYQTDPSLYSDYCRMYAENFDTDYISSNIYPFTSAGIYKNYCEAINIVSSTAREYEKDFICYFQGTQTSEQKQLTWQFYTLLSFGCKTFVYWLWNPGLVDDSSLPTSLYYNAQSVQKEILAISNVYVKYKNVGAMTHKLSDDIPYLKFSDPLNSFDIIKEINCPNPLLIGCFNSKDGTSNAFTIVNMTDLTKNSTAVTAKIRIDGDIVTAYYKGIPQILEPQDGLYTFALSSGEGVFVTVD